MEGVSHQVNDQLKRALDGSQTLLGKQDQVELLLLVVSLQLSAGCHVWLHGHSYTKSRTNLMLCIMSLTSTSQA